MAQNYDLLNSIFKNRQRNREQHETYFPQKRPVPGS